MAYSGSQYGNFLQYPLYLSEVKRHYLLVKIVNRLYPCGLESSAVPMNRFCTGRPKLFSGIFRLPIDKFLSTSVIFRLEGEHGNGNLN
jgi:hypothetical protein